MGKSGFGEKKASRLIRTQRRTALGMLHPNQGESTCSHVPQ
ncbi:hypothetical protein [uncultured Parabacteroides sp.]|nr:hypothetical protein [uncultured Parabacteroides sp.]